MFNAVLFPAVRYHQQLSPTAKLIFCEITACIDDDQCMDNNPAYFERALFLTAADVKCALDSLQKYGFVQIKDGKLWARL